MGARLYWLIGMSEQYQRYANSIDKIRVEFLSLESKEDSDKLCVDRLTITQSISLSKQKKRDDN